MTDVEFCDLDADGFVDLNLPSIKDAEALNGLDPLQFTVTYHGSQADADNNVGVYLGSHHIVHQLAVEMAAHMQQPTVLGLKLEV